MSSFERVGCIPELIRAVDAMGWLLPTPVQDEAIPLILGGGDVMVAAETGSGKTGAFALPILQIVYETLRGEAGTKTSDEEMKKKEVPKVQLSAMEHDAFFQISGTHSNICESRANWQGGRANIGVKSGRYYFEVTIINGLCRVGWCTNGHSPFTVGTDQQGYGYGGTGKKAFNGQFTDYGEKMKDSDVIGCSIDLNKKTIGYSLNGKYLGIAFDNVRNDVAWFPCATVKNGSLEFNFGRTKFKYLPNGYTGIQQAAYNDTSLAFKDRLKEANANAQGGHPIALCVAPTRDLATQIHTDFTSFCKYLTDPPVNLALCIGGVNKMTHEIRKAHIVVGTIGSLIGLLKSNQLHLDQCRFFVIDEADRVLDKKQGNQNDILAIYSRLGNGVQVMLFSATLHSDDITTMSEKLCNNPQWVDLKGKEYVPDTVHHCILAIDPLQDLQWTQYNKDIITDGVHQSDNIQYNIPNQKSISNLSKLTISEAIKLLKPRMLKQVIDAFEMDQCLVFCRTRLDCTNINHYLTQLGGGKKFQGLAGGIQNKYSCAELHSGIPQHERNANLDFFKKGAVRFLICTDVAARGIDIKQLPFVINVTMPAESEDYIHRVGRVGRQDEHGIAISLVSKYQEKVWYHKCPSRGNNCNDTRLVEQGGCTIWFNEASIFKDVEKRLGNIKIPSIRPEQCVPGQASKFVKSIELKDPLLAAATKKVEELKPKIEELNALEIESQNQWLQMPFLFNNMCVGNRALGSKNDSFGNKASRSNSNDIGDFDDDNDDDDGDVNTPGGSATPGGKKKKRRQKKKKKNKDASDANTNDGPLKG